MDILYILFMSLTSLIVLFILTKIMGNKQMSQLSMFDYINGITIGSIAAEMATSLDENSLEPLIAMAVYAFVGLGISLITCKSIKARRLLNGAPLILFNDGIIYEKNMLKSRIDVSDFMMQCRVSGYFEISDLQTAILEPNGKISFLPKSNKRPANPDDLKIKVNPERMVANVIIDGNIMRGNLRFTGNDEKWLRKQLDILKVPNIKDIFLATCDYNNILRVYPRTKHPMKINIFE